MARVHFRHSDIATGTWSLAAGAHFSAEYAVTNLGLILPFNPKPFRANSGTCTPRLTTPAPVTVEGVGIVGRHNLAGATVALSSGAGLSSSVVVPANVGRWWVNAFKDLRGLSGLTSTTFDAAISGHSADVEINKIFWILSLREWRVRWRLKKGLHVPTDHLVTELDVPLDYELEVRSRPFVAEMNLEADRAAMELLVLDAAGRSRVWGAVPDTTAPDLHVFRFASDTFLPQLNSRGFSDMTIEAIEQGLGKAL